MAEYGMREVARHLPRRLEQRERGEAAIADDLGGDALPYLGGRIGVPEDRDLGMSMRVDEAGRDDLAGGVDALRGRSAFQVADFCDGVAGDRDVRASRRRARAVHHT